MKVPGVYRLTHLKTGLFYIGHTNDFNTRKNNHISDLNLARSSIARLSDAYIAGDQLDWILYPTLDKASAKILEKMFIAEERDSPLICNRMYAGYTIPDHQRLKLSLRGKENPPSRLAIDRSAAKRRGVSLSPETIEKMRRKLIGQKRTDETKAKISLVHKGKPKSQEQRTKMSAAKIKPVEVNGVVYVSTKAAALALGITRQSVRQRVLKQLHVE